MLWLWTVSVVWGLSFGLIGVSFAGVPPATLALLRLGCALPLFLWPWKPGLLKRSDQLNLIATGAVQYGLMYVALFSAFHHLQGHQVALLTVTTPLYVSLFSARSAGTATRWGRWLLAAVLAVCGAGLIHYRNGSWGGFGQGFMLMQLANAAFAWGQVHYRSWARRHPGTSQQAVYAWLYLGAVVATLPFAVHEAAWTVLPELSRAQWLAAAYLGAVATGWGFYAWNRGAAQVSPPVLSVMNNVKIPVAVALSITVFGEAAPLGSLIAGSLVLLGALWLAQTVTSRSPDAA